MKGSEGMTSRVKRVRVVVVVVSAAAAFFIIVALLAACSATPQATAPVTTSAPETTATSLPVPVSDKALTTTSSTGVSPSSTTTTIYTHAIENPTRIVIPSIKADAQIVNVGPLKNGNMQVPPFGLAGWFDVGPAPGAPGPAVIVGHVDTKTGPDVFYRLKKLKAGDEILVYDKSGDAAAFVVDSSELVSKSALPTTRIWNDTPQPVIRLITCGGTFDRSTGHYRSNTIVYGHLVK